MQLNMFSGNTPYKITKPIRLIELFGGYGSQHFALKYLGANVEQWKLCEWAIKSIQAYKDVHFTNDNTDYSKDLTQQQIIEYLTNKGISTNYNNPMTIKQIKRLSEKKQRQIYNNIIATHNLVNISQVKGSDLEIIDTDKYEYIMCYSFPCQDLSLAGKQAGMKKDSKTRSGLLWEVERILDELNGKGKDNLPQVLLMENVSQVIGTKNIKDFSQWLHKLESLGYSCFWQVLNAKDYGIPQNRERCFMVSILGNYCYEFPQKIKLELKLKDLFETNVDEKFYLSDKMKNYIASDNEKYTGNNKKSIINRDVAVTITTRTGNTRADTSDYICEELPTNYNIKSLNETLKQNSDKLGDGNYIDCYNKKIRDDNLSGTITTRISASNNSFVIEKEENLKQNNKYYMGTYQYCKSDNFMKGKNRFSKNKEISDTLQTTPKEGIVEYYTDSEKQLFTEDGNIKRYINSDIIDKFEEGQMATTSYPNGYGHGTRTHNESITLNSIDRPSVKQNLRIRKLTPKESFRLMGIKDTDFENISKNQSNASLYHLAGDSICTSCLMGIFGKILNKNYINYLDFEKWWK